MITTTNNTNCSITKTVGETKTLGETISIPTAYDKIETTMSNDICDTQTQDNVDIYYDEYVSWLKFNDRVLNEAQRKYNPILERLTFLGIADSNMDEFIRTKYRGEKKYRKLINLQTHNIDQLYDSLKVELIDYGIKICDISELRDDVKAYKKLKNEFMENLYPMIQPLILANELPLPDIDDGGSFVITTLGDYSTSVSGIIKLPDPFLIKVKTDDSSMDTYVVSDDVVIEFISHFYREKNILKNHMFRILRRIDSLSADSSDYIYGIQRQLQDRKKAEIQLIDSNDDIDSLKEYLDSCTRRRKRKYLYGLSFLKGIKDVIERTDLMYDKAKPRTPISLVGNSMFDILTRDDVLVHFPYESFQLSSVRFLKEASVDPNVIAIKQTLYRVRQDSPLVTSLITAAKNGKQVVVLLELKAKMDEKNNLELVSRLKEAGCYVIFGPVKIKTHAKVTLIIRKEGNSLAKYVNISTGNFNDSTAKQYEDLSYFVKERSKLKIGEDLCDVFNYLGGCSNLSKANDLLISPTSFRSGIEKEIDQCIKSKLAFQNSTPHIIMKTNSFTDKKMADKLYEASKIGVKITLIVRGMCIVKSLVPGLSDNIEVISIVGRYLEHSRIYEFTYMTETGETRKTYIGSGDMMERNLDHRVEVITPIKHKPIKDKIHTILTDYMRDTTNLYRMTETGEYQTPSDAVTETSYSVQNDYIKMHKKIEKRLLR